MNNRTSLTFKKSKLVNDLFEIIKKYLLCDKIVNFTYFFHQNPYFLFEQKSRQPFSGWRLVVLASGNVVIPLDDPGFAVLVVFFSLKHMKIMFSCFDF